MKVLILVILFAELIIKADSPWKLFVFKMKIKELKPERCVQY